MQSLDAYLRSSGADASIFLFKLVVVLLLVLLDKLQRERNGEKEGHKKREHYNFMHYSQKSLKLYIHTLRSSSVRREGGRGRHSNWQNLSTLTGLRYSSLP